MKTIDKELAKVTKNEQKKSNGLKKTWLQPSFEELSVNKTMGTDSAAKTENDMYTAGSHS